MSGDHIKLYRPDSPQTVGMSAQQQKELISFEKRQRAEKELLVIQKKVEDVFNRLKLLLQNPDRTYAQEQVLFFELIGCQQDAVLLMELSGIDPNKNMVFDTIKRMVGEGTNQIRQDIRAMATDAHFVNGSLHHEGIYHNGMYFADEATMKQALRYLRASEERFDATEQFIQSIITSAERLSQFQSKLNAKTVANMSIEQLHDEAVKSKVLMTLNVEMLQRLEQLQNTEIQEALKQAAIYGIDAKNFEELLAKIIELNALPEAQKNNLPWLNQLNKRIKSIRDVDFQKNNLRHTLKQDAINERELNSRIKKLPAHQQEQVRAKTHEVTKEIRDKGMQSNVSESLIKSAAAKFEAAAAIEEVEMKEKNIERQAYIEKVVANARISSANAIEIAACWELCQSLQANCPTIDFDRCNTPEKFFQEVYQQSMDGNPILQDPEVMEICELLGDTYPDIANKLEAMNKAKASPEQVKALNISNLAGIEPKAEQIKKDFEKAQKENRKEQRAAVKPQQGFLGL